MTGQDADLDEILRGLFADRDPVQELMEARRAAEEAPPPKPCIIPQPEFPHHRSMFVSSSIAIYRCTAPGRCPWACTVDTAVFPDEALVIPVPCSSEDLSRAITERAERRITDLRERIEGAIREHFTRAHPGQEPPDQVERLVREETLRRQRIEEAARR